MGKKKGKKQGGPKEEQGADGKPKKGIVHGEEAGRDEGQQPGPAESKKQQQRKKEEEPSVRASGGDGLAGPSQQPQGKKQQHQPQEPPQASGFGRDRDRGQRVQEEHMRGVPQQSPSQTPQAWGQKRRPAEMSLQAFGPPPGMGFPRGPSPPQEPSGQADQPLSRMKGPRGPAPQAVGPSTGTGSPRGLSPQVVGPSPSTGAPGGPAPRTFGPPTGMGGPRGPSPQAFGSPPGMGGPRGPSPPQEPSGQAGQPLSRMKGPRGRAPQVVGPSPGTGSPRGLSPQVVGPSPSTGAPGGPAPQTFGPPPGMGGPRGPSQPQEPSGGRRPKGRTAQGQMRAQIRPPAPTGAVRPIGDAGVAAITRGIQTLQIPKRKSCGSLGRRTKVATNYFSLDLSKLRNKIAIHYDVELVPALPKRLLRRAMEEFRLRHFPDRHPAFDGRRNLYSSRELPQITDDVMVHDEESDRGKEFKITIKYASEVNLESLSTYMQSGSSTGPPQKAIQALDVVLRNAPAMSGFVQVGRSFFTPPRGRVLELGDGLEMWYGIFQSAILGWKPFINVDVAHKGFPKSQNVVDAINEICRPQDMRSELTYYQKENFMRYIRGLKIDYMIPGNPSSKRTFKVNNIAECASKLRFELDNGQSITVHEYFTRIKRVPLKYPHLPCLHVGSLNRPKPIYVPSELCTVSRNQVVNRKMNERQTSEMIKQAATSTEVRKQKIMDALTSARFNQDPCVQEFGLSVGGQFEEVDARVLNAPQLEYKGNLKCTPRNGVWRPSNFVSTGSLNSWIILNLDSYVREDALRRFGDEMQRTGRGFGMDIRPPLSPETMRAPTRDTAQLESFFKSMKNNKVDLVVVVVPDRGDAYAKVKQVAELTVGVLTQCIKGRTMQRMNPATCSNILLKVNSKLNGVNHTFSAVSKPPCLGRPVMIVGADVTHPSPDQTDIPSVAAVCASHDPKAFKYNIQIRLQQPKVEIIQDLEAIIKEQLLYFDKTTNYKPDRIIFFRDGVSEGQFAQVLDEEVKAIRRACSSLNPEYKPMVTFLVVQKRHHTRFFPLKKEDEDGKNHNVPPGLIVDSKITHPVELDFFLVSHASIQGVSRPTKYHLLWNDDDKMTTDDLEQLTYYLCHMFSRCTRSVSYPAPTYNAHLAAYRARVYLEGRRITLSNLANEQRMYFESAVLKDIIRERPMYFV